MDFKDYYQTLGVEKTATEAEIKKAYRKMARKYHPDVSKEKDAEAKMKEVNEANAVLSDVERRSAYDKLGNGYQSGQDFQPPPNWDEGFEYSGQAGATPGASEFSDFFANLFSQSAHQGFTARTSKPTRQDGEDKHARVMIDLIDAYQGSTRTIQLQVSGLDATGHVQLKEHLFKVHIPQGVKESQMIRLAGQGAPGFAGGKDGDLYLQVHFNADSHYRIDGRDVYQTVPITPWEAALGATIKMPTPSGAVEVKVPAASKAGQKLRLKARGIPSNQSSVAAGDLYIVLEIALPPADTDQARQLYEQMSQQLSFNPRQHLGV